MYYNYVSIKGTTTVIPGTEYSLAETKLAKSEWKLAYYFVPSNFFLTISLESPKRP